MASVKGIGGAFILAEDPARLAGWYRDSLGIDLEPLTERPGYFKVFSTRDLETSIVRANPVFAIHRADEKLAPRGRGFVINLRVDDLVAFLEELRDRGVKTEPVVEHPYGLFSNLTDPDGNRIELYEERFPDGE